MTAENAAVKDVEMVEMIDSNLSTPPYAHRDDVDTRNVEKGNHGHGTIDLSDDDYIVTVKTWVVVTVLSFSYGISFWAVPSISAIQGSIATQLGTPSDATFFTAVYTIGGAVAFMVCGANSDLFGRRWFIIGGNIITFVGYIVGGTANSTRAMIAAMALIGFGGGNCQLAAFALPELLPNKWRPMAVVMADSSTIFSVIVGPVAARFAIQHGEAWRWLCYGPAIAQAITCVLLIWLYYPPKHPRGIPWHQAIKELDYFGAALFTVGLVLILTGIVYSIFLKSSDPKIVASLVAGFGTMILFGLWETFADLKQPLTPTRIWTRDFDREFTAPFVVGFIVTMFFYGTNITYPTMISVFFTNANSPATLPMKLSLPQGLGISTGAVLLTIFGNKVRHYKWTLTASVTLMVFFGGLTALATPDRLAMTIAFVFLEQMFYGWCQYLSITYIQMGVDQIELGIAGGLAGVSRTAGGSIAVAVYSSILGNAQGKEAMRLVPAAVEAAGLDASAAPAVLAALPLGAKALSAVPGMTTDIAAAAGAAFQQSYVYGLKITAISSVAFGVVGIVACLFCNGIDHKMTNKIEVFLENTENADKNVYH